MWKLTAVWIALQVFFFGGGYWMLSDGDGFGFFEILCGFFVLWFGLYIKSNANKEMDNIKTAENMRENAEKKRNEKIWEIEKQLRTGKWTFPAENFYRCCKENNILQLDNEFAYVKAQKLAESCIREELAQREAEIDADTRHSLVSLKSMGKEEYILERFSVTLSSMNSSEFSSYIRKECLERYLTEGKKLADSADQEELARQKTIKAATPNLPEKTFLQRTSKISYLRGSNKRVKMLDDLVSDLSEKIVAIQQGEEAMKTLGMLYMQQQKKEGDWAIAGGIADGLAGPVAGFMAASQVIENNREVRRHNEIMRNTSRDVLSGSLSLSSNRYELERQKKQTEERCKEAKEKITLSKPNAAEIWNHIQVGRYQIKKEKTGVLHVALPVHIETPFALDVPANVKTVVDGTLKAEVRFEDKLVGTVNFPLPLYGIPTNMAAEVTLDGMLDRSVEFNGEYTLKMLDSHNLWIMEA